MGHNKKLDEITSKFPENKEICEEVLKKLNNTKVKIKVENDNIGESGNEKRKDSLYVAISDTIFIGNIKDTYTRIQTICHECLHSVQPRRLLLFNFGYSNIYILYFWLSVILTLVGVFKDVKLHIIILAILSFLYYVVRAYLETDAMTKARFLAKEYMLGYIKKNTVCTEDEVEEIVKQYDELNAVGIPIYNYMLMIGCIRKVLVVVLIGIVKSLV